MGVAEEECALGRDRALIGIDADPRLSETETHVVLGHQEVGGLDPMVVLDNQIDGRILR